MTETNFLDSLKWRYATKKMSGKQIPQEKLDQILEAVRLAPSSFGFTPYSVVLVQDKELQAKLLPHCYNQSQIVDASALLVFAPWKNINEDQVDIYMKEIAETRNVPVEALGDFANAIKGKINHSSNEDLHTWASKQAYIALGFGLAAAAVTNPKALLASAQNMAVSYAMAKASNYVTNSLVAPATEWASKQAETLIKDNLVCNNDGEPYAIIHQYDRVNGLRQKIHAKYGAAQ